MVREEVSTSGRPVGVWKECVKTKEGPDAKAAPMVADGRSSQNNSRRKRTTTPTSDAAVDNLASVLRDTSLQGSVSAVTTAANSSSGVKQDTAGATAHGWLEAPPDPPPSTSMGAIGHPLSAATLSTSSMSTVAAMQHVQESAHSGEVFLMEMLAAMDQHMQQLRETQQGLVATVEMACRRALGRSFVRLVLVGSVALRVETPGSDVDVVCFTRRDGPEAQQADGHYDAVGLPVDVLRRVHWSLQELVSHYADNGANFSMELIDDARVPILRVLWGSSIAVDVSVDQSRPVDHVRWFQRVGAAPRPTAPPPAVAPLVTLTLRCVKWWIRQRQVPRTKEGGMATIAWLLMAVHVCSLPETHEQAIISGQRPMVALLASLAAFFHHYAAIDGLDGVLMFAADGSSSEFRRSSEKKPSPRSSSNVWGELSVLDPTREGNERLDLAPRLPPATQLLLSHELRRASQRLHRVPKGRELSSGDGRRVLEEVFEPLPEGMNNLPSFTVSMGVMGVLLLWEQDSTGPGTVELAIIDSISPRPGWIAPFLHRGDDRSELSVRLLDVEERTGRAAPRKSSNPEVVLCPCHFICRVQLDRDGKNYRLDTEGLERMKAMKLYLSERGDLIRTKDVAEAKKASSEVSSTPAPENLAKLPSPSRAGRTP